MFVHPEGPFGGGEVAEEAVGMGGATGRPDGDKAVDEGDEDFARVVQVAVVSDLEAGNGGGVASHRLVLLEGFGFDHASDQAADQHPRGPTIAESQLHADGAVSDGLTGVHLAPEARAVGSETRETIFELLDGFGLI